MKQTKPILTPEQKAEIKKNKEKQLKERRVIRKADQYMYEL